MRRCRSRWQCLHHRGSPDSRRHAEVIRYFVVSSHYRGPVNYNFEQLTQAAASLERIYNALREVEPARTAPVSGYTEAFRRRHGR